MKVLTSLIFSAFTVLSFSQSINLEIFATGLSSPVNMKHANDSRLFVVERQGVIKIINTDGSVEATPYLDIDTRVINSGGEQGLLAMAFHPNYSTNGYFYVNYINNSGDTVISRFSRSTAGTADDMSELILMTISQPFTNHNGGDMHFGPDGYLYISTGDGGSGGDPGNRAQNLSLELGKILRIDVDVSQVDADAGILYYIPSNNPFIGDAGALDEIWAYGLRNPWKFSFDSATGDLWIADVGQSNREEISQVPYTDNSGINLGWKCYEGTSTFFTSTECNMITHTPPIAEYNYGGNPFKCSISGGYRYRGTIQTNLQGLYFFADYCSGEIGYVAQSGNASTLVFMGQFGSDGFSGFAEDINGELYIYGLNSGTVYRILDENLNVDEFTLNTVKMYPNPVNEQSDFLNLESNSVLKTVSIYSLDGKLVKAVTPTQRNKTLTLPINTVGKGFYLVEIESHNGAKETRKLIVN